MNILLAVDGSSCSQRAVDFAIAHTGSLRVVPHLHLLHVHPPIPIGRVQSHIGHDTLQSYYREESETQLDDARRRLEAANVAFSAHIHVGLPGELIARLAADLGCGLIIMGTHGRGGLVSVCLGSVAAKVLHLAHCPLLLVK